MKDGYKRLMKPSMETGLLNSRKKSRRCCHCCFAENMRQLLLAPPLGQKRVLAIDLDLKWLQSGMFGRAGWFVVQRNYLSTSTKNEFKKLAIK